MHSFNIYRIVRRNSGLVNSLWRGSARTVIVTMVMSMAPVGSLLWPAGQAFAAVPDTTIILTSGSSWTVPADFSNVNTIQVIGAGGGGGGAGSGSGNHAGAGGGGGAFAAVSNLALSPGSSVVIGVGVGGAGDTGASAGTKGGDTYFNRTAGGSTCTNTSSACARGGNGGAGNVGTGGTGGSSGASFGTTVISGGNGANATSNGGGGGGAAGSNGTGVAASGSSGGNGDNGSGGAGGGAGTAGSAGTEFDATHGSGGGGGGATTAAGNGGNGGNYGAGGGGGQKNGGDGGNGSGGLIVITYTPVTYTLTSSGGAGGTISPNGATVVHAGDTQTFSITPSANNIVSDVVVDSTSEGRINTRTFSTVASDHTIAATFDGGWSAPSSVSNVHGATNAGAAFISDDSSAQFSVNLDRAEYANFGQSIPAGATIDGIEVALEGNHTSTRILSVRLWNASTFSFTPVQSISFGSTDSTQILGGSTDTWGDVWTPDDLNDSNFKIQVGLIPGSGTGAVNLDQIQLKVHWRPAPVLTVTKIVHTTHGGTKVASDFPIFVDGQTALSGVPSSTPAGLHTISETTSEGYVGTIGGDCAADGTITLVPGDVKACTITNDDQPAKLTIIKHAIGGDGTFNFSVTSESPTITLDPLATEGGFATSSEINLDKGTYNVNENEQIGWDTTDISCTYDGVATGTEVSQDSHQITVDNGNEVVCTFTDTKRGSIVVHKNVVAPDGTTDVSDDHSFSAILNAGGSQSFSENSSTTFANLPEGTYTITEGEDANYDFVSYSSDSDLDTAGAQVVVTSGTTTDITITNKQKQGSLIVKKVVTNPNGGTAVAGDFSFAVNGFATTTFTQNGENALLGENDLLVDPGTYTISEAPPAGAYAISFDNCENLAVASNGSAGESTTCTITNSDIPAGEGAVTVVKHVTNDNGGTLEPADFTLHLAHNADPEATTTDEVAPTSDVSDVVTSGQSNFLAPGSYTVSEDAATGYAQESITCYSGETSLGTTFTLSAQESVLCTVTNNDIPPSLTLSKVVINDNGGTAVDTDFTVEAIKNDVIKLEGAGSATSTNSFQSGTYDLFESGPSGYSASGWTCDGAEVSEGNFITLALGQTASCSITNNDIPAKLYIVKHSLGADHSFDFHVDSAVRPDIVGPPALPIDQSLTTVDGWATTSEPILLNPGSYDVIEDAQAGWSLTGLSCEYNGESVGRPVAAGDELITVDPGDVVVCTFTNTLGVAVSGEKWRDVNGNGVHDDGDAGLPGWTITATPIATPAPDEVGPLTATDTRVAISTTTDESGNYSFLFHPSDFGEWRISETPKDGWQQTYPESQTYDVSVQADSSGLSGKDFGNWQQQVFEVQKWNDKNHDARWQHAEPSIAGWTMGLGLVRATTTEGVTDVQLIALATTSVEGVATLRATVPGDYVVLEESRDGWNVTYPATTSDPTIVLTRADGIPSTPAMNTYHVFDVPEVSPTFFATEGSPRGLVFGNVEVSQIDDDGDGIPDVTENAAPNNGDVDNNETPDGDQGNIISAPGASGSDVSVKLGGDCTTFTGFSTSSESASQPDASRSYPAGLVNFSAHCSTIEGTSSALVTLYVFGTFDPANTDAVKFSTTTGAYTEIPGAVITAVTIGGLPAIKITYTVVDNGPLDSDPTLHEISDPVGPGVPVLASPTPASTGGGNGQIVSSGSSAPGGSGNGGSGSFNGGTPTNNAIVPGGSGTSGTSGSSPAGTAGGNVGGTTGGVSGGTTENAGPLPEGSNGGGGGGGSIAVNTGGGSRGATSGAVYSTSTDLGVSSSSQSAAAGALGNFFGDHWKELLALLVALILLGLAWQRYLMPTV